MTLHTEAYEYRVYVLGHKQAHTSKSVQVLLLQASAGIANPITRNTCAVGSRLLSLLDAPQLLAVLAIVPGGLL